MKSLEEIKEFVLTLLGHAVSGGVTAAVYEVTQIAKTGEFTIDVLLTGVWLGGSIGFLRSALNFMESLKKPKGTASAGKAGKRRYFGL